MLNYDNETKTIKMIAKDTGDLIVNLDNYLLASGDTVYFTVNNSLEKEEDLISKVITDFPQNKAIVRLTAEDTDLPVGNYYYDIQINTADGRVDTVLGPAKFKIMGGVKY